eukprot:3303253-Rhodomonas_salina.1
MRSLRAFGLCVSHSSSASSHLRAPSFRLRGSTWSKTLQYRPRADSGMPDVRNGHHAADPKDDTLSAIAPSFAGSSSWYAITRLFQCRTPIKRKVGATSFSAKMTYPSTSPPLTIV